MGVEVAPQDDLLSVVVQPLAEAGDIHALGPVQQVIAVPLSPEKGVIDLPLAAVQRRLSEQDIHCQAVRQLEALHPGAGKLRHPSHAPGVLPQGPGIQVQAPDGIPGRLGQAVVPVRLQGPRAGGRDVGGQQFIHCHALQQPAQAADVVPVEVGQQHLVQTGDALLFQEISGVDPPGAGVQLPRMVVPHQAVVSAVHQHGKALFAVFNLPYQGSVAVAHIDKIQNQHCPSPSDLIGNRIAQIVASGNQKNGRRLPNFYTVFWRTRRIRGGQAKHRKRNEGRRPSSGFTAAAGRPPGRFCPPSFHPSS